ncbi:MAG: lipocalin family protein [Chitinophagaceae bacterium]|nr:lipocalin family protein [Chitinophagaceae bacterium]MCW5926398.1 lipocalin family protein [Chitinophagaceae bacterium]
MKQYITTFALIAFITGLFSCKKDAAEAISPFKLLTADVWIMTANTSQIDPDSSPTDDFTGIQDCAKDDEYQFLSDGKYYHTNGPIPCGAEPAILSTGNWQLSADERSIFLTISSITNQYEIVELTKDKLVTRQRMNSAVRIHTYKH